jgi:UDPglucose 6-dehydrogenase
MRVCTIGAGYVGLVTAAGFAETGNTVTCVDVDREKIARLESGAIPIYEPGLEDLVARNVAGGRLAFSTEVRAAVAGAEVVFVAVGTPPRADGAADLRAVDAVAEVVASAATGPLCLVLKSTVPVGTNARVRRIVDGSATSTERGRVHVVSNPEFLKEGDAVADFLRPDRIVIGVDEADEFARDTMRRLYHPLSLDRDKILWMDPASAELTKYVSNTMLAMRISFMNEIAGLCEKVGADIHDVRKAVGADSRIGAKFLYAGPGYGGSCFPKDVQALLYTAHEHGLELELAGATDRVNRRQKGVLLRKLKAHFDGYLSKARIAIWGTAFKPNTDDIRESPAMTLIDALLGEGATVVAHDPQGGPATRAHFGDRIVVADDAYAAAEGADGLVLLTEWRQYQNPDFERLRQTMRRPLLLDGRNIWSTYGLRRRGFVYDGIGVQGS